MDTACLCNAEIPGSAHSDGWYHSLQISVIVVVAAERLVIDSGYFRGEVFMGIIILDSMC